MSKPKLFVSVSGGRTSGYMAKMLKEYCADEYEMKFVFSNTGLEHEDTLRFLNDLDNNFGLDLVWVEAIAHHGSRKACSHKVVSYDTAARRGEPMEEVISKYGIPNVKWLHCTRETKLNPMKSYMKSIGWLDYQTSVGIRADESRRVSASAEANGILYPLIDMWPTDKEDVLNFWEDYDWDLKIPEWQGNCTACFKKSYKKLAQVYSDTPEAFDFTNRMEEVYGRVGAEFVREPKTPDRVFFRMSHSTNALISMFATTDGSYQHSPQEGSGCSESCEIYPTD